MSDAQSGDEPLTLSGGQDRIRNAYRRHESGLFVLSCVPGSGKSTTVEDIAAESVIDAYVDGASTPEQGLVVISFNQHEAETLIPAICDRIRDLIRHNLTPQAAELTADDAAYLTHRVRQAPHIGTVDAFLRGLFQDLAPQLGFDDVPVVGERALLNQIHDECYTTVQNEYSEEVAILEQAYPTGKYDAGVADMLEEAVTYCRDRGVSPSQLAAELHTTRDAVYPTGRPESETDLATVFDEWLGHAGVAVPDDVRAADVELYDHWGECLSLFETVCSAYLETYREQIREQGVVSHTDIAYLVAGYFAASTSTGVGVEFDGEIPSTYCAERTDNIAERYRTRYQSQIKDVLIDEAQDVSAAQHTALSYVLGDSDDTRVFLSGDLQQNIYTWRHADPSTFEQAIRDGVFLGSAWSPHVSETASVTYRSRPDVAAFVNAISQPVFNDPSRGDIGNLSMSRVATQIESTREQTTESNVHIPTFVGEGYPGTKGWVSPDDGVGEADSVAAYLAHAFDTGVFTDDTGDPLTVTVLFRRRTRMGAYEQAFAENGLVVENTSEPLFSVPVVEYLLAVCDWLVTPFDADTLEELCLLSGIGRGVCLGDGPGVKEYLQNKVAIDAVIETDREKRVVETLERLLTLRDLFGRQSIATALHSVIDVLSLDTESSVPRFTADAKQRRVDLDRLVDLATQLEGDDELSLHEFRELTAPFRETPRTGPLQPSVTCEGDDADVVFKTIHNVKGDEDDVIVLADPGFNLWWPGIQSHRFVASGDVVGLAPPTDVSVPSTSIPCLDGGVYAPTETGYSRDVGIRWATAHWRDYVSSDGSMPSDVVGPDRLTDVFKIERAESWRLLYVALTRAREHLVVPLPDPDTYTPDSPRDRWVDTIIQSLGVDSLDSELAATDTYTLDTPNDPNTASVEISIFSPRMASTPTEGETDTHPSAGTPTTQTEDEEYQLPTDGDIKPWVPRFVPPNKLYPLTEDSEEYHLDHLLGRRVGMGNSGVCESVSLPFAELGIEPTDVGTICHDVLSSVIDQRLSAADLREISTLVDGAITDAVRRHTSSSSESDIINSVTQFVDEYLFPQLLDSDVWKRIQRAECVETEKQVTGSLNIDGVVIEMFGEIDVITTMPDGTQHITDFKITFADPTENEAVYKRYELQLAGYAYLLDQQQASNVRRTVEAFGHHRETVVSTWPPDIVEHRLVTEFDL